MAQDRPDERADADARSAADARAAADVRSAADSGTFGDLDLRPELLAALAALGYEEPTPIQREAIPAMLTGRDLLGQAATGTGKTAAFALPLLHRLASGSRGPAPTGLVLAPTRELTMQVSEAIHKYGRDLGARVLPVYGGQPIGRQLRELARGVDVVVATPGRALDHISRGTLVLTDVQTVVLDEADEMLDMGFAEDLEAILNALPAERQTVLFSATIPSHIDRMVRRHLRDPLRVRIERAAVPAGDAPRVRQSAYLVPRAHKPAALGRLLDVEAPTAAIVFCRTRGEVDQLTETLNGRGYRSEPLHGGMSQEQRDRVMQRLRAGSAELLVATDVAARGLDVDQLTHVFNYDVPSAPESYVHRIGRVGRAGREGVAITLAEPREQRMLQSIERLTGQKIAMEKLPSVADLQARRLDLTRAAVAEHLAGGDLDRFSGVLDQLLGDHDLREVALAALALAHQADGPTVDEQEIPEVAARPVREREPYAGSSSAARPSGSAPSGVRGPRPTTGRLAGRDMTRLFIGAGRQAGVRPQDLVGAIANESSLSGREIGAIEITERFSLVDVPSEAAEDVITALRGSVIKGRKATVRRER
ncbi:MAG: deaD [Frankiales bacterium]|nr:deaD [Frankiales bacterium]